MSKCNIHFLQLSDKSSFYKKRKKGEIMVVFRDTEGERAVGLHIYCPPKCYQNSIDFL